MAKIHINKCVACGEKFRALRKDKKTCSFRCYKFTQTDQYCINNEKGVQKVPKNFIKIMKYNRLRRLEN